ncbi:biotin transporter BioY [Rhizobiales bacterium TNE-4]|nr:biotin transporter BioY [Rhizobiales bacterium TNE-4]MBV1826439.1 biotin transporter BioY [Rhizobiales bacterium TNE-4]
MQSASLMATVWPVQSRRDEILRGLVFAFAGAALLTLSAKVKVPFYPVPMTMQTMIVLMIAMAGGLRLGVATVGLYLMQGALGFPVFADTPERGIGLAYMMGPTGGYLVGFLAAAAFAGWCGDKGFGRSILGAVAVMSLGHVVIFAFGYAYLATLLGAVAAFNAGVAPFAMATILKVALGAALMPALWLTARKG